jgi:hypothetical protein
MRHHLHRFAPIIFRAPAFADTSRLRWPTAVALWFCILLSVARAGGTVDFTNYEDPLYTQIVNRITDKITARLGTGPNKRDRYFIIPFAYENRGNDPEYSHSFMTVVRVMADGKEPDTKTGLKVGTHKRWKYEAFNISWIPADFMENPNLCVFSGIGARLFPKANECPLSVGKNFSLEDTITIARNAKVAVGMWGPYEITRGGFDLGVRRKKLLDRGEIKYRADDRLYRKDHIAINCFHAMASLEDLFPNGGIFGTGFNMWGLNGTARVLIEYVARANEHQALLEPVDVKRDRFGFVYAETKDDRHIYDPFAQAVAYHH